MEFKFIEIAANLTDSMYDGEYHGKKCHVADRDRVLERAWAAGVEKIIITGGSYEESKRALELSLLDDRLFCTVGVHPTRCNEFEREFVAGDTVGDSPPPTLSPSSRERTAEEHLSRLMALAKDGKEKGKVVAIGEFGLDYDRLHFCDAKTQKKYFEKQFALAEATGLPLFLHMRAAGDDFLEIVRRNEHRFPRGVVHSFTGSEEEMRGLLSVPSLAIGLNGCSLKTEENLNVVSLIPTSKILLETDSPYCEIRPTHASYIFLGKSENRSQGPKSRKGQKRKDDKTNKHGGSAGASDSSGGLSGDVESTEDTTLPVSAPERASFLIEPEFGAKKKEAYDSDCTVKGRNEPCQIREVFLAVAASRKEEDFKEFAKAILENTNRLFFPV